MASSTNVLSLADVAPDSLVALCLLHAEMEKAEVQSTVPTRADILGKYGENDRVQLLILEAAERLNLAPGSTVSVLLWDSLLTIERSRTGYVLARRGPADRPVNMVRPAVPVRLRLYRWLRRTVPSLPSLARALLGRWGLAGAVLAVLTVAAVVGLNAEPPSPVPEWALRQPSVFRAEVGLIVAGILYVGVLMLVLSISNRTFSKISAGPASVEIAAHETTDGLIGMFDAQEELADSLEDTLQVLIPRLEELEHRLHALEARDR